MYPSVPLTITIAFGALNVVTLEGGVDCVGGGEM
jgi:hypothetical protein